MENINIIINDRRLSVAAGSTILEVAATNGIRIPTLCKYNDFAPKGTCRMCVVEVENSKAFKLACATKVSEGMVIHTDTPAIIKERKMTLELLLSKHPVDCHHCMRIGSTKCNDLDPVFCETCFFCDCVRDGFCELQTLEREYGIDALPYEIETNIYEIDESLGSVIHNQNKCIKCRRCVDICSEVQTVNALGWNKIDSEMMVTPVSGQFLKDSPCVRCGRCVNVCPTGAIFMLEHKDKMVYYAHKYGVTTVAQISPSIIYELEELFKMESGKLSAEHIASGLKKIGVDYVVTDDYSLSKAQKAVEKLLDEKLINKSKTVILTNSFAAQNFVNNYFKDLKDNMIVYDSAQKAFGEYVKSEFAADKGLDPIGIRTISLSNDNENGAEAYETDSVDFSLNARELYRIFLRTGGNMNTCRPCELDNFENAEVISKHEQLRDKMNLFRRFGKNEVSSKYKRLFDNVAWTMDKEYDEFEISIEGKVVKAAIAKNLGQSRTLLEKVEKGDSPYAIIRLNA